MSHIHLKTSLLPMTDLMDGWFDAAYMYLFRTREREAIRDNRAREDSLFIHTLLRKLYLIIKEQKCYYI
ncbi:hypothetical protein V1478_013506 [Vespula squamosa]|uniref:Uncharacterized protein n=1 Tax=Vespula squamosa TaxID=30214 RepID=A0ABD2AB11_VESSQ